MAEGILEPRRQRCGLVRHFNSAFAEIRYRRNQYCTATGVVPFVRNWDAVDGMGRVAFDDGAATVSANRAGA